MAKGNWITPEELTRKKEFKRKALVASIPLVGVVIGALSAIIVS